MGESGTAGQSIWKRGLIIGVFAFVGVVGGAYVGHLIVGNKSVEARESPSSKHQPFYLYLRTGDLFPYEDYSTVSGAKGNFEQLLVNKESVIFFVDLGCNPCHDFLRFWNTTLSRRLLPGVQVVVCLPKSAAGVPPEFAGLVKGDTVVFVDTDLWKAKYNLVFYPIMAGTDGSGFITHIQYGFADEVDYEITQRYLTADKSLN